MTNNYINDKLRYIDQQGFVDLVEDVIGKEDKKELLEGKNQLLKVEKQLLEEENVKFKEELLQLKLKLLP